MTDAEAMELFCARSGLPASQSIRELCRRLDNLPLAVELAAARARVLSPDQLLERLSDRLDLLKGRRDAETRQRTLRATIAWSYELLDADERRLFARLSVFAGGCTVEVAEAVCDADLDTLQSLVEKSLVRHTDRRFLMLETIREFAAEVLAASGEGEPLRARHAEWVTALVTEIEPRLHGADQLTWLDRLEAELGNLRAALHWALDGKNAEVGGRIAAASFWFWQLRSHLGEGERWLREAANRATEWPPPLRARLLQGHGQLTYYRGTTVGAGVPLAEAQEAAAAARLLEAAVELWRKAGAAVDVRRGLAESLSYLAIASGEAGDPERSFGAGEEAVSVARDLADDWALGFALWAHGTTMVLETARIPDVDRAESILDESVERLRRSGDRWALAAPLFYLGIVARRRGDFARAMELIEEATTHIRAIGDKYRLAIATRTLSDLFQQRGDADAARHLREEADLLDQELGRLRAG
jgi:tetratricopeptide (TPR) repeat protein